MPLQFLVGRSGAGKSHQILAEITEACQADPFGPPIFLIVPEQASYQAEKSIVTSGKVRGYTRVQVLGFERLAQFVYTTNPAPSLPVMTSQHRDLLVLLLVYRQRRERPGTFLDMKGIEQPLAQLVTEIRQQMVSPSDLANALQRLDNTGPDAPEGVRARLLREKLTILSQFIEDFDAMVAGRFHEPAHGLASLVDAIRSSDAFQGATVYFDSFIDFTPMEEQLVVALAKRAARAVLALQLPKSRFQTLRTDRAGSHPIFGSTERGIQRLLTILHSNGVPMADPIFVGGEEGATLPRFKTEALALIESGFLAGRKPLAVAPEGIEMIEAASPREEARLAAEKVAALLLEHPEWSPAEIAILTRDLADYGDDLSRQLHALHIPHFLDQAAPLQTHPIVVGIRALLSAVEHPGAQEHLLELGKSGLLAIDRGEVDFLDLHLRQYPRSPAEWNSDRDWGAPPSRNFSDEEGRHVVDLFTKSVDKTRRRLIRPVHELRQALANGPDPKYSFPHFARALVGVVDGVIRGYDAKVILSESDIRILKRVGELLADAVEVVGDEVLPLEGCVEVVHKALGMLQLPRIPPLLDQVFIGQVDRSRQPAARVVIVMGLAEGIFPRPLANRTMLSDAERDMLEKVAVQLRPPARELFRREALFGYRAFTAASERLILMRPRGTNDGSPLQASGYWDEVARLLQVKAVNAAPIHDPRRCWRPRELAVSAVLRAARQLDVDVTRLPPPAILVQQLPDLNAFPEVQRILQATAWRNEPDVTREQLADHLDRRVRLSATALDRLGDCGYQYFIRHLLRPAELVQPEFEQLDAGNYAHSVLQNFSALVRDRKLLEGDDQVWIDPLIDEALATPSKALERSQLLVTASGRFLHERLNQSLRSMCHWMVKTWRGVRARPEAEEQDFAIRLDNLAPESGWEVLLSGKIDRLDTVGSGSDGAGRFVVDYKLTGKVFEYGKWYQGCRSQLPLYIMAARAKEPESGPPLGALYLDILPKVSKGKEAERKYRGLISLRGIEGLVGAVPEKLAQVDGYDLGRTNPRNKIPSSGSLVTDEQLIAIEEQTRQLIAQALRRLIAADFAVAPSRFGNESPCTFCDRQRVCQVDYTINRPRHMKPMNRAEVMQQLGFQADRRDE